ncbi:uncharacterized protein LOC123319901 [Coccinella septempunctata]|uniref:uncharacterized protein LOC123319901 n=1 Tax=Coccinella septempunctata TaxID=41139 RepID=UPI001D0854D4|nr:uncharacterized protein LOC123319901 [Coccinella septempunctata]
MEATPVSHQLSEDSGCISGSFSTSAIFGSTPSTEFTTPTSHVNSRKRKYNQSFFAAKKLQDVIESTPCTSSPIFSSTLNESLVDNLENFHIRTSCPLDLGTSSIHDKSRDSYCKKKISFPATPEKRIGYIEEAKKFKSDYYFNLKVSESPVKEAHDILYANLKPNVRKPFSPFKFRDCSEKLASPAKKCLFETHEKLRTQKLFSQVVSNPVIMSVMYKYLSNGDIYRLSHVSASLKDAILTHAEARKRYEVFMEVHKQNKENYQRTPPSSPEKSDSPPGSPSRFNEYVKIGKLLNYHQSLTKCPRCEKPSIVENSIGQCQNVVSCGYIYCQKCFSFSETGPEDFYDSCQSSALVKNSSRSGLSDMSNSDRSTNRFNEESSSHLYSIFQSPRNSRIFEESSGFISENEYSPKPCSVKRNLSQKLKNIRPKTQVFHLFNDVVPPTAPLKKRVSLFTTPVISLEKEKIQDFDPPSPPKIRILACSKQSKRNLKRLTR